MCTGTGSDVTITDVGKECSKKIAALQQAVADLHLVVQTFLTDNFRAAREASSYEKLPNFGIGYYVLIVRECLTSGERILLRWRGPHRVVKPLSV